MCLGLINFCPGLFDVITSSKFQRKSFNLEEVERGEYQLSSKVRGGKDYQKLNLTLSRGLKKKQSIDTWK